MSKNRKSNNKQMAVGYKLSLIFLLIAVTGVHSAIEEAAPVEQYSDTGDTVLKPSLAAALKLAMKGTSGSQQNQQQQQQLASLPLRLVDEYDDGADDDVVAEIKRTQSWNQLHGGWGKRASSIDTNDGPGGSNWNRMNNLWGKRANNWNNLNSGWG